MPEAYDAVDAAMHEADQLRKTLKKKKTNQVRSSEECSLIKAVCLTWFNNHRSRVSSVVEDDLLSDVDKSYKSMLAASDRATSRSRYDQELKSLRKELSALRESTVAAKPIAKTPTADTPPTFVKLVADPAMQEILMRRWNECAKCVSSGAPLSATVMMGGLLEALLLARIHRETNKSVIFAASKAPKDKATGKTQPLQEWTLRHYIDVAHELKWISSSAKDVGEVVRDYRNYIHPYKELSHGVVLNDGDAKLFWEIAKNIARQLLT